MQAYIDHLIEQYTWLADVPTVLVYASFMIVCCFVIMLGFVAPFAGIAVWMERRVSGLMQSRIGPNRVGPQGFLQWVADAGKLFLKEDFIPDLSDKFLFLIAPYIVFAGMFGSFVVIPWTSKWIPSDLNIGILYIMAITSVVVVGILMAGWSSNNKWSLIGGLRSTAQIVSYEIPVGLAIMTVVLLTGSLSMQTIIDNQGSTSGITGWYVFHNPFTFIAFFVYFIGAAAEGNRTPFDLPEAESELVTGYNTEYSGFRFAAFFLAEFANLYVIAAVATTLFLGGWQAPRFLLDLLPTHLVGLVFFLGKAFFIVFILMWLRWTLPRLRVDQLMIVSWTYLTPIAFFCLLGTAVWMLFFGTQSMPEMLLRLLGIA